MSWNSASREAVSHEPGDSIYSGDRVGWPQIRDEVLALLGPFVPWRIRVGVMDVAAGQEYLVAVHRGQGGPADPVAQLGDPWVRSDLKTYWSSAT